MSLKRFYVLRRAALVMLAVALGISARADLASVFTNLNGSHPAPGRPRLPSILFIQCDSLGFLDLGCNGQKQFATPNLDRLAAAGTRFTNYDAAGVDGPASRAALMTGRDPGAAKPYFAPGDPSLAQVLKAAGYYTCLIGEWNFGDADSGNAPWQKGFNEFAGYYDPAAAEDYYAGYIWRYTPRGHYDDKTHQFQTYAGQVKLAPDRETGKAPYVPDLYTQAATRFIAEHRPYYLNHYRPFFLWLSYATPRPNRAEAARTGNGIQVPTDAPYSDENWPQAEKNKAAMISRLDSDIGTILDSIQKAGMSNNIAIFFSSATLPRKAGGVDPMFFPSMVATNDVRLPMIARWDGNIPAGRVSGAHWTPGNFLATAAEIGLIAYPTNQVQPPVLSMLCGKTGDGPPAKN